MIDFVKPALVLYGISILIFFPNIDSDTRAIGIIALILAACFWLCHSLFSKLFCKVGNINDFSEKPNYQQASSKFFTVTLIQTYKIANPYTGLGGFTRSNPQQSRALVQPMHSDSWTKHYISNYMGLISSAYTPVYSLYAYRPTAPPLDENEGYSQVSQDNQSPCSPYSPLPSNRA